MQEILKFIPLNKVKNFDNMQYLVVITQLLLSFNA